MYILVMSQYFYPETFRINSLCIELVKRGHEVTVLTGFPQYPKGRIYKGYGFHKEYEHDWNGIRIERLKVLPRGKTPIGMLLNCLTFVVEGKKWVKHCTQKYDVIFVFGLSPITVGLPAVEYKKKNGTPIYFNVQDLWPENIEAVLGIHNRFVIGIINKIVDTIYFASDKILCSSEGFVENIKARGVPAKKLIFWPQFCGEPDFKNVTKPDIYCDDVFKIVFAGNIGEAQGLDLLIETAKQLKNRNDIKFYLVGDGRARKRLESTAKKEKLDNIIFVGKVSVEEADRYIHFADCAYLSFKDNKIFNMTIPAKLQSYMVCGTPILAVSGGESASIIREAECGVVCPNNGDVRDLCKAIDEISHSEHLQKMSENAKKYYFEHFSMNMLIDKLVEEIKKTVQGGMKLNRKELQMQRKE